MDEMQERVVIWATISFMIAAFFTGLGILFYLAINGIGECKGAKNNYYQKQSFLPINICNPKENLACYIAKPPEEIH